MKQPKKKQPINVQLSKKDLTELFVALKDFMTEEISLHNKRLFLNQSEMEKRIYSLEIVENSRRKEIQKLKLCCSHDDRLDRIEYYPISGNVLAAVYKCERCGRENKRTRGDLSRKEKKALRKLGVKI